MRRLYSSINGYFKDIELWTLLTRVVERLHVVSHLKHETFTALQYSQDFGMITKESLKRLNKWAPKYFTHETSYYLSFRPARSLQISTSVMRPLPSEEINPVTDSAIKEFAESIVRWGKGQHGRKLTRRKQRLYHRPSTRSNKISPKGTCRWD